MHCCMFASGIEARSESNVSIAYALSVELSLSIATLVCERV